MVCAVQHPRDHLDGIDFCPLPRFWSVGGGCCNEPVIYDRKEF
jgi:hypothetical protein